jgi:hypothetical protein
MRKAGILIENMDNKILKEAVPSGNRGDAWWLESFFCSLSVFTKLQSPPILETTADSRQLVPNMRWRQSADMVHWREHGWDFVGSCVAILFAKADMILWNKRDESNWNA